MPRLSHKTLLYGAAGALGGTAAWTFIVYVSGKTQGGLLTEMVLGALSGMFIGGFIWSHEAIAGRQLKTAVKRALYGAAAGLLGGAAGAGLGNSLFSVLGIYVADLGGLKASFGILVAVALGWAVLGMAIGMSGGLMIHSRERILYGVAGGSVGGFLGGVLFNTFSATNIWSTLIGLLLLGMTIGTFISLVEEALVSAKIKVIKGRHAGREFPLIKEVNIIGRDDRSDVCLSGSEGVADRHAFIRRDNGHYTIETDQQGKVVYVNHKPTRNSRLTDGDVVRVGSNILMFSAVRKAAAAVLIFVLVCAGLYCRNVAANQVASVQITQFDLSGFPTVKAYVSALDGSSRPVRGLGRENFSLQENNGAMTIEGIQATGTEGKREPLCFSIVLDRSGSMAGNKIQRAKESVLRFISLMEPGDKASLFSFSDTIDRLESLTDDRDRLKNAVKAIQPGGHTALYDAIASGVESVRGITGRRAVVILTDGIANRGVFDIKQAINTAANAYVSVYVIGLGKDVRTARLERIAQETGGSYFFTPSPEGLSGIYETISKRIHNEYAITYQTEPRAEYLRNVLITLDTGMKASRSYFQPASSLFGTGKSLPAWAFLFPLMALSGLIAISFRKLERTYATGHLSLVRGRGSKKELDVNSTVRIGRDERNELGLFRDDAVDQQHANVLKENGRYVIEDRGSSAGTFVNRKKISGRHELKDGDIIDIGKTTIVFSEESRRPCTGCGSTMKTGAKFCPKCGMRQL